MKTSAFLIFNIITPILMMLCCAEVSSQTVVTFEDGADDYKSVSVFDLWEDSPFMDGRLQGNAMVIDNHLSEVHPLLGYAPNNSRKIVGFQRSRYGSNCYGVRIDLRKSFRLLKQNRYVHVLINRPVDDSRCLLITMGKRTERAGQSKEVIQNKALSCSIGKGQWYDVVFPINGFSLAEDESPDNGIDIYSLIIVPDLQDRSGMAEDFACYIDNIEINDSPDSRFCIEEYQKNVADDEVPYRFDHQLYAINARTEGLGDQIFEVDGKHVYYDMKESFIHTTPGKSIQPMFYLSGLGIHGYVYVDWKRDGIYHYDIDDNGRPTAESDIVSYDGYYYHDTWLKSDGTPSISSVTQESMPAFTIPMDVMGIYPIRFKLDCNNLNPAGSTSYPRIIDYGGAIVDLLLNVHGDECVVNASQLNGDFYSLDNRVVRNYRTPYGQPMKVRIAPAPGFTHCGCRVRYGYNLSGDSIIHGIPQYFTRYFDYDDFEDGTYLTLPAEIMMFGEVEIEGFFTDGEVSSLDRVTSTNDGASSRKSYKYSISGIVSDKIDDCNKIVIKEGKKLLVP